MRALLATSDKTNIIELGKGLEKLGWELIATGKTFNRLTAEGISVLSIATITGSPEMLDGRVKTLHPKIFGGLLYIRGTLHHEVDVERYKLVPIDLVACNLYPFEQIAFDTISAMPEVLENIDIGGSALIRAAAKNFQGVIPLIDPNDYFEVLKLLDASDGQPGGVNQQFRHLLAQKVFSRTAQYDLAIAAYFQQLSSLEKSA